MAYNKFSLQKLQTEFGIKITTVASLFDRPLLKLTASDILKKILLKNTPIALSINTEKARSEFIVAPVLMELHEQFLTTRQISLFSGTELNADKESGLNGRCDFIISLDEQQLFLTSPIVVLVEAKKDNVANGIAQCIAEMIGARLFNQQNNQPIERVYGVVTTGSNWKFLSLEGTTVYAQSDEIYIDQIEVILGTLATMIENK
jgi:hypothetical protein